MVFFFFWRKSQDIKENTALKKFKKTGTVEDARQRVYYRSGGSSENIAPVREIVAPNPKTSICHRIRQLHI